jgi:hypothetical protein
MRNTNTPTVWTLTPAQIASLSDADVEAICPRRADTAPDRGGMDAGDVAAFFAWRETLPSDGSNWSFDGDVFASTPTDRSEPTRAARRNR